MRARMRQEEANQQQQEILGEEEQKAMEREGPPPEQQGGMPPQQGGMPEDPTQAGPAQERLAGGPDAQQIRQREFEANAPE